MIFIQVISHLGIIETAIMSPLFRQACAWQRIMESHLLS